MNSDSDTLNLIRTSFAGREELIERAFRDSVPFRALCEDYRDCVAALHRWKQRSAAEAPPRWQEYAELQMELGLEIQTWLEAMETDASHSGGSSP